MAWKSIAAALLLLAIAAPVSGRADGCAFDQASGIPVIEPPSSDILRCSPMNNDECQIVSKDSVGLGWSEADEFGYKLCRKSTSGAGSFEAVVNLAFMEPSADGVPSRTPVSVADESMIKAHFKDCMMAAGGEFRSQNGGRLRIRLADDRDRKSEPPRINVALVDSVPAGREISTQWTRNIECSALIHETFHLLGMVDEYQEKGYRLPDGRIQNYSCRTDGPSDSIMNQPVNAIEGISGHYREIQCDCASESDLRCRNALTAMSETDTACPGGTRGYRVFSPDLSTFDIQTNPDKKQLFDSYFSGGLNSTGRKIEKEYVRSGSQAVSEYRQIIKIIPLSPMVEKHLRMLHQPIGHTARVLHCACNDPARCGSAFKGLVSPISSCPAGTIQSVTEEDFSPGSRAFEEDRAGFRVHFQNQNVVSSVKLWEYVPPKKDWLLYPAEFRAIVFPGCRAVNKTFYGCAKNAYLPDVRLKNSTCRRDGVPNACQDSDPERWLQ